MFSIKQSIANSMLEEIISSADAGDNAAKILIYNGIIPSSADDALDDNFVLVEIECSNPCATTNGRVLTFNTLTTDNSVNRDGTATFFRLHDSNDNVILQGIVSSIGGVGNLKLPSIRLIEGGTVNINSATIILG